jgi:hypothetical protein
VQSKRICFFNQLSWLNFISSLPFPQAKIARLAHTVREQAQQDRIHEVVEQKLDEVAGARLDDMTIVEFSDGNLTLDIIARSSHGVGYQTVQTLQEEIGAQLVAEKIIDEIALTLTVIRVTDLDPLVPPTPTPGPSPTPQPTANPEMTPIASALIGQAVAISE